MSDIKNNNDSRSYRTVAEAAARLRELEVKYDLYKYTVDGYSAWQLLRFWAAKSLQSLPFQNVEVESTWCRFNKLLFQSIFDLPKLLFPHRARYVVNTFSSALNEKDSNCWKDIYFDDLLKEIGNCYKIEVPNNPAFFCRRKTALIPIAITTSPIYLLASILTKLHQPPEISKVACMMAEDLQDEQDLHFLNSHILSRVLCHFYWSKRIYKLLLMRIGPDFLLYKDTNSFEICSAAKELDIKAIEFQHGLFGRNHPNALPGSVLPYKSSLIVHDKLFLYGDFWKRELDNNNFYKEELCVVGSIRMDRYRKARTSYKENNCADPICHIVLTTQGFAVKKLIDFISRFLQFAEGHLNYQLYIKLHPIYDRDTSNYDAFFASNKRVQVISGSGEPFTFELLTHADLHLSISSACHYDALGLGVPTVVLALPNHESVLNLVEAGHAKLAHNPQDLFNIAMKWPDYSVPYDVSSFYFRPNALDNIKRELGLHT